MTIRVYQSQRFPQFAALRDDILIIQFTDPPDLHAWAQTMFRRYDQDPTSVPTLLLVSQYNDDLTPDEEAPQPDLDVPGQQAAQTNQQEPECKS